WPALYVLPERLFAVSELAQKVSGARMTHARSANRLLAEFQQLADEGKMRLPYRPLEGPPYCISFFDASLGKSDTYKEQFDHVLKTGHLTAERQTMLDILAAKQLIEQAHMMVAWVPTWRQFADGWTEDMVDELFSEFKSQGMVCLRETVEDRQWEARRADL
ncbi:unnamed protein product, partial [Durusdinium trenchii]